VQYGTYMGILPDGDQGFSGVLQGDFGEDFRGRAVSDIMGERFPVTIRLAVAAIVIETIIGITAGVLAGICRKSLMDDLVLVSTTLIAAIPLSCLSSAHS